MVPRPRGPARAQDQPEIVAQPRPRSHADRRGPCPCPGPGLGGELSGTKSAPTPGTRTGCHLPSAGPRFPPSLIGPAMVGVTSPLHGRGDRLPKRQDKSGKARTQSRVCPTPLGPLPPRDGWPQDQQICLRKASLPAPRGQTLHRGLRAQLGCLRAPLPFLFLLRKDSSCHSVQLLTN